MILKFENPKLNFIIQQLARFGSTRLVGGCVRDKILGIENVDYDVATELLPNNVMQILAAQHIKTIPTGLKYGTVTAIMGNVTCEITTLRKDIKCYGRSAEVEFGIDFEQDAMRRDFTINAMSYCLINNRIFDYCDGISDLANRRIRFIGDPSKRIEEDYLRILRFVRFGADYANEVEQDQLEVCSAMKQGLLSLSRERINIELHKILDGANFLRALRIMHEAKILDIVLNQYDLSLIELAKDQDINRTTKYALLLHMHSNIKHYLKNLLLSNKITKEIEEKVEFIKDMRTGKSIQHMLNGVRHAKKDIRQYLEIAKLQHSSLDIADELSKKLQTDMPIDSRVLISMGYSGKILGLVTKYLEQRWIEGGFSYTVEDLVKCLADFPGKA